jgi:putative peptide maturation system protein
MPDLSLLDEALEYLSSLAADHVEPDVAQQRLEALRESQPNSRFRLLWQREAYDGSLHYDLLITRPGSGVVSLSSCPDDSLPWPLRGGQRMSERLLLTVNGVSMEIDQAVAYLDFLWAEVPLAERLVTACLIQQEVEEEPVSIKDEELQRAMDAFRRSRGLLTAAATKEWMDHHGLSHMNFEELVAGEEAVGRLRKRKVADRARTYLEQNQDWFDSIRIFQLIFPDQVSAEQFAADVRAGGNFYACAERIFTERILAPTEGMFCITSRRDLTPELSKAICGASPDSILGPFTVPEGHAVIRVVAVVPAILDEATVDLAERRLFADWLEERRKSAKVEWLWGNTTRTRAMNQAGSS